MLQSTVPAHYIGVLERAAVYPLLLAQFIAGTALLAESARLRPVLPATHA